MSSGLVPPLLKELVPSGFEYGTNLLVEFDPDSIWYETSLTIAAHAVKAGIRTDYHTFQHPPDDIRKAFGRFGLEVKKLEDDDMLWIEDSYTVQTGLGAPQDQSDYTQVSVKLSDWSIGLEKDIKGGMPEIWKRRLHIDDNTGVLLQYNEEKTFIDFWRTRVIPHSRARDCVVLQSLVRGAASAPFYKQFESLCDGIIDFKIEERENELQHHVRVRSLRGRGYDSQWRRLSVLGNGEVAIVGERSHREFEFEADKSSKLFDHVADAFIQDYMVLGLHAEKSGWRTLGEIGRATGITGRALYAAQGGPGVVFAELLRRGLLEVRLSHGERGRGGTVMRVRIAYDKEPVKSFINERVKTLRKRQPVTAQP